MYQPFWDFHNGKIGEGELRVLHRQMTQTLARGAQRMPDQKPRRTRAF